MEKKRDASKIISLEEFRLDMPDGERMAEVFSVCINKTADCDTINLYGTIKIISPFGIQFIYNRERNDPESIGSGATSMLKEAGLLQWISDYPNPGIETGEICMLTLTGPSKCTFAYDSFSVEVHLWDHTGEEVYEEEWDWNPHWHHPGLDSVLLTEVMKGKYGQLIIDFAVFQDAIQAAVEVTIIDCDGKERADVYGVLATQDKQFPAHENVLFQRVAGKHITVKSGARIPLSRSAVVVSLDSVLTVMADLRDCSSFSVPPEIVKGTADFNPQLSGTCTENITGNGWEIEVKVTWAYER